MSSKVDTNTPEALLGKDPSKLVFDSDEVELKFWIQPEISVVVTREETDPIEVAKLFREEKADLVYYGNRGYYDCTGYTLKPEFAQYQNRVRSLSKRCYKLLRC